MGVVLTDRDLDIFLDIYDFGYVHFDYLWPMYWSNIENEHSARVSINTRMKKLSQENYIYSIPYDRRVLPKGRTSHVFTLGGKGIAKVKELYGDKHNTDWDPNKKYRKGAFIEHQLEIAMLSKMVKLGAQDGLSVDIRGEGESAYRVNDGKHIRNVFRPDACWFIKPEAASESTPFFIEYERTKRRSIKKMHEKVKGQNDYFVQGLYEQHDLLQSHYTRVSPVLAYISDYNSTNQSYRSLILERYKNWKSHDGKFFCSNVIFAEKSKFEEDPFGPVFTDLMNKKRSLYEEVVMSNIGRAFTKLGMKVSWNPSYLASQPLKNQKMLYLDGLAVIQTGKGIDPAFLFIYIDDHNHEKLKSLIEALSEGSLLDHRFLTNSINERQEYNPKLVIIDHSSREKYEVGNYLKTLSFGSELSSVLLCSADEILNNPLKSEKYFDIAKGEETTLF